jgi:cell division protein FtsB
MQDPKLRVLSGRSPIPNECSGTGQEGNMKILQHPFFRLMIILVSFLVCYELLGSIISNVQRIDSVAGRKAVLEKEQKRNEALKEELRVATSASFLEKQAREKLGLVKEGETIILMGKPDQSEGQQTTQTPQDRWERWWKLFF